MSPSLCFVLKENERRNLAHQARVQGLQDQIDELRKMLKDAENQLLKVWGFILFSVLRGLTMMSMEGRLVDKQRHYDVPTEIHRCCTLPCFTTRSPL
jgi:glutaredoxin 2